MSQMPFFTPEYEEASKPAFMLLRSHPPMASNITGLLFPAARIVSYVCFCQRDRPATSSWPFAFLMLGSLFVPNHTYGLSLYCAATPEYQLSSFVSTCPENS